MELEGLTWLQIRLSLPRGWFFLPLPAQPSAGRGVGLNGAPGESCLGRSSGTVRGGSSSPSLQELFRKVRSILNKLTPQMFSQLMKQVTDLTVDTEERLKGVIDLVFEKAIDEPSFSVAYANMCRGLVMVRLGKGGGGYPGSDPTSEFQGGRCPSGREGKPWLQLQAGILS